MARFNTTQHTTKPAVATTTSPIATVSQQPDTTTALGAPGWTRTTQGELFLMSCGAPLDGKDHLHESGLDRDSRFARLVRKATMEDPQWTADMLKWLRGPGNMRTAAIVGAAEFTAARLDAGAADGPSNRKVIDSVLQRPDEPGELLAYWTATYGRAVPKPVKRGIADAVRRLYSGRSLLKYDTAAKGYRFGDILNLVHAAPDPDKPWQGALFQYALDRRHNPDTAMPPASNRVLTAHRELMALPVEERRAVVTAPDGAERLAAAGMTWEALAGWLQGPLDKAVWEAMIPSMGIMALIRNLRNFDQAGVSDETAQQIIAKLTDREVIARSRQFPFRFLSAHRATAEAGSLRWAYPLERALNLSLTNVPRLDKRTLVLVDRSPSMFPRNRYYTPKSDTEMSRADQAAVFGSALAVRAEAPTLVEFGGQSNVIHFDRSTSILKLVEKFQEIPYTDIPKALTTHYDNHDRVIILTDEQTRPGHVVSHHGRSWFTEHVSLDAFVPFNVPVYMWNFAGYEASAMPSGSNARFSLGGLADQAFKLIPLIEAGAANVWPWQLGSQGE